MSHEFSHSHHNTSEGHCHRNTTCCSAIDLIQPCSLDQEASVKIDTSVRFPVMLFFGTALFWLIAGCFLEFLSALKLVIPSFLDGSAFFTYGRLYPVANDLLVYGWAIPAALGVILWILPRVSGAPFPCTRMITCAALLWNTTIFFASLAILSGYSTSVQWLEYPNWASFLLFISFLLVSLSIFIYLKNRCSLSLNISHYYLIAALCIFPWLYASANFLLTWNHVQGSAQGPIHWWYGSNLVGLWLTLVALGSVYYLIPKKVGLPISSYYLTLLGFWSLLFFASWNGMTYLIGGPIPAWMVSASVVSSLLIIIPVIAIAGSLHQTMLGHYSEIIESPTLRFIVTGMIGFVTLTALSMLNAIPSINAIFHFTDYTNGLIFLSILGFFSMIIFGAMYYSIPRLLHLKWPCLLLISRHFWYALVGISLLVLSMTLGGLLIGLGLEDPIISFRNIISYNAPWHWLNFIAWGLLLFANGCFGLLFGKMLWQVKNPALETASFS